MATTLPQLELRVSALERRAVSVDEDLQAISSTLLDTNMRVRKLEVRVDHGFAYMQTGFSVLAQALGVELPEDPHPTDPEDLDLEDLVGKEDDD